MNVVLEWVMGMPSAQAGAIDVIAVRKADGTISCSPFHVKLGKASKKGEKKIVKLKVNGKAVDLSMKLGPAGEAFFVERTREFPRRELNSSYPGSPYGEGVGIDSAGPLSPRDEADVASPFVAGEREAVEDLLQNQNLLTR
jgi:phosphatidate phosphatase LPIN